MASTVTCVLGGELAVTQENTFHSNYSGRTKVCLSVVPCLPHFTTHSTHHTHLTYVHNTPSPVVGGGGAVVVSPITSATDGPRMKTGSMNIHNRDKGEVASTGPVSQLVNVNVELCTWSTV